MINREENKHFHTFFPLIIHHAAPRLVRQQDIISY